MKLAVPPRTKLSMLTASVASLLLTGSHAFGAFGVTSSGGVFTVDNGASAFVVGTNTMTINVVSGTASTGYLSPSFSFDCVDLY